MKKPNPKAYGLDNELWRKGGKKAYEAAYLKWAEYRAKYGTNIGRTRTRPIHPSWEEVLKLFNPNDKERSQGAFCRWSGINRALFSTWQTKPLLSHVENWILEWDSKGQKIDNGE